MVRTLFVTSAISLGLTLSLLALNSYLRFDGFLGKLGAWLW